MYKRQAQKGRPFSLIVIDIDNFRSFNDAYGYAVGDAIIARFGRYLQTSLSTGVEMVGRVGSEEYLAIVDGADRDVLDGLTSDLLSVRLTIDGEGPVSYTHLDVYKRQVRGHAGEARDDHQGFP